MTPALLALISLLCTFQTLAVPLHPRAVPSTDCLNKLFNAAENNILVAQIALGPINTANALNNTRGLLQAQLALLDAADGTTQIHDSGVLEFAPAAAGADAPPAPADVGTRIIAGLLGAQTALNQTSFGKYYRRFRRGEGERGDCPGAVGRAERGRLHNSGGVDVVLQLAMALCLELLRPGESRLEGHGGKEL
ncbi:hypothetical protein B0H19DRAFT_1065863 [Mycena capillaripes]|nr:hypothetical protein B0H19DRAFT_1065863 [Mycena capillaripes]